MEFLIGAFIMEFVIGAMIIPLYFYLYKIEHRLTKIEIKLENHFQIFHKGGNNGRFTISKIKESNFETEK